MSKRILHIALVLICFLGSQSLMRAQYKVTGIVADSLTGDKLPFVNMLINNDYELTTTTDIDGKFSFSAPVKIEQIRFSYVGYSTKIVYLNSSKKHTELKIQLIKKSNETKKVLIYYKENPAHKIIREAVKNKNRNNPEKLVSFKYKSYNKTIYDFVFKDSSRRDSFDNFFKGGHVFLLESVTERKYKRPNLDEELVLATKVSGFKDPNFATLATDLQPFSFYQNIIPILDMDFLNPISPGSINKYRFRIEEIIARKEDTTYVISFIPKKGKNFDGLEGVISINTNGYAIENVLAQPYEKGFINIQLQQKYTLADSIHWFPSQLNFSLSTTKYPSDSINMLVTGRSYLTEVEVGPNLKNKDFSIDQLHFHKQASSRDSAYWNANRIEPLNTTESTTYQVLDSVGEKLKFDRFLRLNEKLLQGKIPYKFVDFDLRKVLFFNDYEKTRLGLGVYSNERLLKHASFGGFAGYGFGDKVWKYGGEISLELSKYRELEMRLSHQFNLKETGYSSLRSFESQQFTFRDYLAYQLDEITEYKADLGFRSLRYLKTKIHLSNVVHSPKYNYFYKHQEQGNTQIQDYTLSNIGLEFKFAYKERLIQAFNQRVSMGTKYPVLYLSYTRGLKDVVNGMFDYDKIEMRIEKELLWKRMGRSRITLDGGYISSPLPYGSLFTGEGSNNTNYRIYFKNSFQTLSPYEFLSDRYFNMYFIHDFGSLLFKTKKFKPSILVHQNIGWGTLRNTSLGQHQQIEFKTKEKGFFESGLQLDNLIRTNYLNIGYIGFGVGVFYRYGPYSRAEELNNFVLKISASFSSR